MPEKTQAGVGVSGLSFLTLYIVFFALVLVVALAGRRHFPVRIPFAASCSLVISAACHPSSGDTNAHLGQVQWGVVNERTFNDEMHCTLSSQAVSRPKAGMRYQ